MRRHFAFVSYLIIILLQLFQTGCSSAPGTEKVQILIIGGGASGISAGIQASRMGSNVLITEETTWLGGMLTSAGVSAIDGNYNLPAGIWGEFRDSLVSHYGHLDSLKTGWVSNVLFEPSVGNKILKNIASKENNLNIWYSTNLISVERKNDKWIASFRTDGKTRHVECTILIDATELGDVAKMCGTGYDIGMESSKVTGESIAPAEANHIIQDLTYVAILKDYKKDVSITRPEGYDASLFACACINELCISPKEPGRMWDKEKMITYGKLPNNKYMINWPIEGNDYYLNLVEMPARERSEALKKAKHHTLCFLYFLQNELGFTNLGLADDEFPTDDLLPFIPYHRESRRIHGKVRFTLNYITEPYSQQHKLYRTNIAVGDYPVDHHHARYQGYENLPDLYFYPVSSYGLPLGTLIPENTEGLIVAEKSISVSNLVNGTTRLQPVVLQIGQAAGTLAALAIKNNCPVEAVPVREVQKAILETKGYLMPYLDVKLNDPLFRIYQRIGATGILRGEGRNVGWSNQTWLRTDTLLLASELEGWKEFYPNTLPRIKGKSVTIEEAIDLIVQANKSESKTVSDNVENLARELYEKYNLGPFNPQSAITRGAFAVLADQILNPFERKVDIYGNYK